MDERERIQLIVYRVNMRLRLLQWYNLETWFDHSDRLCLINDAHQFDFINRLDWHTINVGYLREYRGDVFGKN